MILFTLHRTAHGDPRWIFRVEPFCPSFIVRTLPLLVFRIRALPLLLFRALPLLETFNRIDDVGPVPPAPPPFLST